MYQKLSLVILLSVAVFVSVVKCSEDSHTVQGIADLIGKDTNVGRTFGHNALKRLSFIFLPVMFTLGVISTLLMALAVISVKNLAIGVMLLIVAVSQAVSRLFTAGVAPAPVVFAPRTEYLPAPVPLPLAGNWPAPAPVVSPWGRSDNDATISD